MKSETEDILEKQDINLLIPGKKTLEVHSETSLDPQQVHQFQKFPRPHMPQIRSRTKEKIMNFLIKNAGTIPSSSEDTSRFSKVHKETQNEVNSPVKEIECEKTSNIFIPQEIALHNTELEASNMRLKKLNSQGDGWKENEELSSKTACAHDLEEELKLTKDVISILSAALNGKVLLEQQVSTLQRRLDTNADEDKQLMEIPQKKSDDLTPIDHKISSNERGTLSSVLVNEISRLKRAAEDSYRLEEERNILENQAEVDKKWIKELESSLEKAEDTIRNLNEAKAKMSEENTSIRRRKIELLNENSRLMERMTLQAAEDNLKQNAMERRIIQLQEKLESISTLKKDMELQTIELVGAHAEIEELTSQRAYLLEENQKLLSKAECLDNLEEHMKFLEAFGPRRYGVLEPKKRLGNYIERLQQRITFLEGKCRSLILKVEGYESIKPRVKPEALSDEFHQLVQENETLKVELEVLRRERDELLRICAKEEQRAIDIEKNVGESSSDQHQSVSDPNERDEFLFKVDDEVEPLFKADMVDDNDPDDKVGVQQELQDLLIDPNEYFVLISDAQCLKLNLMRL